MTQVTRILAELAAGDPHASEQLLVLVYQELRELAEAKLRHERPGQTLQATALVHEALMRLAGPAGTSGPWQGRRHFFAAAAEAMRRILIENARRKRRVRHGGQLQRVPLDDVEEAAAASPEFLIDLSAALDRLAAESPSKAELVKLRFFAGLTIEEAAQALDISPATAKRHWTFARAWLYDALGPDA
jgi:RNA polymerase sigma factor (TIGR02999 family)